MKKIGFLSAFLFILVFACKKETALPPTPQPMTKDTVVGTVSSYVGRVPELFINTLGNTIVNEPKKPATLTVLVTDTITLKAQIGIELRGSSSLYFDQKSYGFEFRNSAGEGIDTTILDLPKEEDFILYGPANDKSLLRNVIIYELSNQIGWYASRTRFVQLHINGSYNGLYVLMEKIKRNKNRVNISKIASDNTGGYIIKIDKSSGDATGKPDNYYDESFSWRSSFDPSGTLLGFAPYGPKKGTETYFIYEYPKPDNITTAQKDYIKKYIDDFEKALLSQSFKDASSGYRNFIDVDSFIDYFLLNELSHNPDAYRLSTILYKDKSAKLKIGPIWDFNLAFGNDSRTAIAAPYNWAYNFNNYYPSDGWLVNFWWKRLLSDPFFTNQLKSRWANLRSHAFSESNIYSIIDSKISLLTSHKSIVRHFARWNFLGVKLPFNGFVGQTYQEEVDYLKNWIRQRLLWMDQNISSL